MGKNGMQTMVEALGIAAFIAIIAANSRQV